jgi:hypothetical protein
MRTIHPFCETDARGRGETYSETSVGCRFDRSLQTDVPAVPNPDRYRVPRSDAAKADRNVIQNRRYSGMNFSALKIVDRYACLRNTNVM